MATVQKFNHSMIEQYLKEKDFNYLIDRDHNFQIQFGYDEDMGCGVKCLLRTRGSENEIYVIEIISDKAIPKTDWGTAIKLCNDWNAERLFPKAYLYLDEDDSTGFVVVEGAIDLEKGIHQELLSHFTEELIILSFQFFQWAHKDKGLYSK